MNTHLIVDWPIHQAPDSVAQFQPIGICRLSPRSTERSETVSVGAAHSASDR